MDPIEDKKRKHREYMREYSKKPEARERRLKRQKAYNIAHPEVMAKWREDNREQIRQYNSEKHKLNKSSMEGRFGILHTQAQTADARVARKTDNCINIEQIRDLYDKQKGKCIYTGATLSHESGPFLISLDRIDSSRGHEADNCQLTLLPINRLKSNMTHVEFLELLEKIKTNVSAPYTPPDYNTFSTKTKEKIHCLMSDVKRRAKLARHECVMDLALFKKWRIEHGDRCYLTDVPVTWEPKHWNTGSIDRVDSSKGYTLDNMRIALWPINMMKNDLSYDDALDVINYII